MATSELIESATREQKPGVASEIERSSTHVLYNPVGPADEEAAERANAIHMSRRLANRHDCSGLCDLPEHASDVAAGLEALEALGLTPYRYGPATGQAADQNGTTA